MSDPTLEAANRRAHEVARAAQTMCQWLDYHGEEIERWGTAEEAAHTAMHEAVVAYEEATR